MSPIRCALVLGICWLPFLSGCGSSSYNNSSGSTATVSGTVTGGTLPGSLIAGNSSLKGTNDLVVATPSVNAISVVVGAKQTISIAFTSNDGRTISGFGVTSSLGALPSGWSGPASFTCAAVNSGSACVLNLTYAPTAAASGTLSFNYVFVDNSSMPSTGGTVSVTYAATTYNNVIAAVAPTGQINAVVGDGSQSVSINFMTDDGNAATNLSLTTDLTALPSGWSSTASSFSCSIVSTGSGCQLPLSYAATAGTRGTLTLNYSYLDDSGTTRSGALNIPYATASVGNVVATVSPTGEINAIQKSGQQAVAVTFTTDDGKTATDFYLTSDLTALPTGWSSASNTFTCSSVSTGNGCQLHLTYAPTSLTTGALILNYAYTDGGTAQIGTLTVTYAATTNDNGVATPSPLGQINAVVGQGAQAVAVTFTTDDGRPATALQLTSSLSALPAGWSSTDTTFSCSGFSSGSSCQLPLTYTPTAAGNGTLTLTYTYLNNAGESKSGSSNIPYRATTNDSIVGTPSSVALAVATNSSTPVTITFATDDGNPASGLSLTSDLGALPSGWSSAANSFNCSTVSSGTLCQLSLTYAPTAIANSTLSLNYTYTNDAGFANKTGTVSIPYTATPHLYIAQYTGTVLYCPLNSDGTLVSCAATGNGFINPTGIVFYGNNFAYVADYGNNAVYLCNVAVDGSLSGCASTGSNFLQPWQLAINGTTLYATNASLSSVGVTSCTIGSDGTLSGCSQSLGSTETGGIAVNASYAYVGINAGTVDLCTVGLNGILSSCVSTGSGFSSPNGISLSNGYAYIANQGNGTVNVCSINVDGSLGACVTSSVGVQPLDVITYGGQAYVNDFTNDIYLCTVAAGGALTNCAISDGGTSFNFPNQIVIH